MPQWIHQGDRRLTIPSMLVRLRKKERYARSEDLLAALKQLVRPTLSNTKMHVVRDTASHKIFSELEEKIVRELFPIKA